MPPQGLDPSPASSVLTRESWLTCTSFPASVSCGNERTTASPCRRIALIVRCRMTKPGEIPTRVVRHLFPVIVNGYRSLPAPVLRCTGSDSGDEMEAASARPRLAVRTELRPDEATIEARDVAASRQKASGLSSPPSGSARPSPRAATPTPGSTSSAPSPARCWRRWGIARSFFHASQTPSHRRRPDERQATADHHERLRHPGRQRRALADRRARTARPCCTTPTSSRRCSTSTASACPSASSTPRAAGRTASSR